MASMKGSRPKMHGKGKIRHILFRPAAKPGTFTSEIARHSAPGEFMNHDEPPTVHPSLSHAVKHMKATFAQPGEGAEPDEDDQMPAQA